MLRKKDLLGLKDLTAEEIEYVLDHAVEMKEALLSRQTLDNLRGKCVSTLFYENSTRTQNSFLTAAESLGARTLTINVATSSVKKGESLVDTGKTLDALMTDVIVIRHSMAGAPQLLAKHVKSAVINAGDGMNEHPTQSLLDLFTMREKFGTLKDLKVVLVGDIKHSRVARSNLWALGKLGAETVVVAPHTLLPKGVEELGCEVSTDVESAIAGANVVMGLRLQLERQKAGLFPSTSEYAELFAITRDKLESACPGAIVMHPGPVNRGIEIGSGLVDGASSVIEEQVTNGVAVRMAVMDILVGGNA
ncbi:MAG: aspartate carbamoyltransferase catalytic subunit [Clostridia bacterium]|nr:aspartate carbamoyltransferase catalytic subunit [Clostridia bacterium]